MISREDFKSILRGFDVIHYLDDSGVSYSTGGDNVSDGWVGVKCVFCDDHANHLGINLETMSISCWLCGVTGTIAKYIMSLEGVGFAAAVRVIEKYRTAFGESVEVRAERKRNKRTYKRLLPSGFERILPDKAPVIVRRYFARRRFPLSLCSKYGLGFVKYGKYKLRLIVPIHLDGEVVSFQAVDLTGRARIPYLDCPKDRAVIPNKHLLYGIDAARECDVVRIVEGVTDKWRIGDSAVATFTKNFTVQQLKLFYERVDTATPVDVVFDSDAHDDGRRLAAQLSGVGFARVSVVELTAGDPADLSDDGVRRLLGLGGF